MQQFVVFLRGINGGVTIKMTDLRAAFEALGFLNIRTVLATGNVIFETDEPDGAVLAKKIELAIHEVFNYETVAFLFTKSEIQHLVETNPFREIEVAIQRTPQVTFVPRQAESPPFALPYNRSEKGYRILSATPGAIFSVIDLSGATHPDLLGVLDKAYTKRTTTRNWKTLLRVHEALKTDNE